MNNPYTGMLWYLIQAMIIRLILSSITSVGLITVINIAGVTALSIPLTVVTIPLGMILIEVVQYFTINNVPTKIEKMRIK